MNKYHFTSNILCSFILCWSWMLLFSYQFISIKCNYNSCVCFISASKKKKNCANCFACMYKTILKVFPCFPTLQCRLLFLYFFSQLFVQFIAVSEGVCVCVFLPPPPPPPPKLSHLLKEKEKALTNHAFDISNSYTCICFFVCALFFFQTTFSSFVQ